MIALSAIISASLENASKKMCYDFGNALIEKLAEHYAFDAAEARDISGLNEFKTVRAKSVVAKTTA